MSVRAEGIALLCLVACGAPPPPAGPPPPISQLTAGWKLGPRAVNTSQFSGTRRPFKRIMVVPPSGTVRGGFERELSVFEKRFLQNGVTLISPAVTGRVVGETTEQGGKTDSAETLSDVERALVLARKSGVEAILQVGTFGPDGVFERYTCSDNPATLVECHRAGWQAAKFKQTLHGRVLRFQGRLIEVETGEIVGSLDVTQAIWNNSEFTFTWGGPGTVFDPRPGSTEPNMNVDCESAEQLAASRDLKTGCESIDAITREEIIAIVVGMVGGA